MRRMIYRVIRRPLKTTNKIRNSSTWPGYRVSWQSTLAVTWREFRTWRRPCHLPIAQKAILCLPEQWHAFHSHQPGHSALHLCCPSIQVTNSPAESFVSPWLLAILMLLLPSKSSKCFSTTVKQVPHLFLFPLPKKPQMHIPSRVYLPLSWLLFFNSDLGSPCHLFWSS